MVSYFMYRPIHSKTQNPKINEILYKSLLSVYTIPKKPDLADFKVTINIRMQLLMIYKPNFLTSVRY